MVQIIKKNCAFYISLCSLIYVTATPANNDTNIMKILSKENNRNQKYFKNADKKAADQNTETNEDNINESFISYNLHNLIDVLNEFNDSKCMKDVAIVFKSITKKEKWAMQMFDASSKFPVGLLYGTYYQFGNFDECIEIKQRNKIIEDKKDSVIQGQYCLAEIRLKNYQNYNEKVNKPYERNKFKKRTQFDKKLHWGICLPSSCLRDEIEIIVEKILSLSVNQKLISVQVDENKCYFSKHLPLTKPEIIYGFAIGLFLLITLSSTGFDYYIQRNKKKLIYNVSKSEKSNPNTLKDVVLCFSLIQTIQKFLHVKSKDAHLECICGIKVISMIFIICGHSILFIIGGPVINTNFYDQEILKVESGFFLNNALLVDTFLMISGFLMCYLLLIEFYKRNGVVNFFILYIGRYIRLTPAYIVMLGLYCTFLHRLGSGPLWNSRIGLEQERCRQSWWTNLLYINNYVNIDRLCMFQSWYLAVDYHLFIIAPFIIFSLWKWQKLGKIILSVLISITIFIPFWITYKNNLDPTLMVYAPEIEDLSSNYYFINSYIKTHMRANSYFIGLLFGYLVYKLQSKCRKIPSYIIWIGWIVSTTCCIISMFSVLVFYLPNYEYNSSESGVYASLHRVAWCLFIGWTLTVCITGNANILNKFLSWKLFIPLSRLTYCAYLVNGFVEICSEAAIRLPTFVDKYELIYKLLAHIVLTFSGAFVLCILFESPIHGIERVLLSKDERVQKNGANIPEA